MRAPRDHRGMRSRRVALLIVAVSLLAPAGASASGGWSAPASIDTVANPDLTSVSCATPTFCVAVDWAGNALAYNGTSWSSPVQVDPNPRFGQDILTSVSCPTSTFCRAVGVL